MKPLVLALDDERGILDLLSLALEVEGYEVVTTSTAAAFRAEAAVRDVAVFLIDLTLPDGNGFSLVKELRQSQKGGIIILSGRSSETDHVVGLEIGADDYITKPFRLRELAARVNAVYRRSGTKTSAVPAEITPPRSKVDCDFVFEQYRLSIGARRVWQEGGKETELTTAEFDLLVALLRQRGQVMSRDQLMNAIKGRDWESYDRAVDGLVSRLRRKLQSEDGTRHFIRTVHGIGYSFAA